MKHLHAYLIIATFFIGCYSPKRIAPMGIKKPSYYGICRVGKVIPGFVRIDTEVGIKALNRYAYVYRLENEVINNVGLIKLVEYHDGSVIAKIIKSDADSYIKPGDYVHLQYKGRDELNVGEYIEFLEDEIHELGKGRSELRN